MCHPVHDVAGEMNTECRALTRERESCRRLHEELAPRPVKIDGTDAILVVFSKGSLVIQNTMETDNLCI